MNKQEFVDRLRMALNGRVSPGLVMDNVNYYQDYINTEIRKGRTEEEVLESLGDPRLIARTIIQTNGGDNRSGYRNTVYGNGEYREAAGQNVHRSYTEEDDGYGTHQSKVGNVLAKLPGWVWLILGILVVVLIFGAVFSVLSFLAPVLIPLMLAMGVGAHGNRTLGASAIGGMLIGMSNGGSALSIIPFAPAIFIQLVGYWQLNLVAAS